MQDRSIATEQETSIPVSLFLSLPYVELTPGYNQREDEKHCLLASKYKVSENNVELARLGIEAAGMGWIRTLQYLFLSKKYDLNKEIFIWDTRITINLLLISLWLKQNGVTQLLLDQPNLSSESLDYFKLESYFMGGTFHENALIYAMMFHDLALLEKLLKRGANPDAKKVISKEQRFMQAEYGSAMEYAIQHYKAGSPWSKEFYFEAMEKMLPFSKIDISKLDADLPHLLAPFVKIEPKVVVVEEQKREPVALPKTVAEEKQPEPEHNEQDILDQMQSFINQNRARLKASKGAHSIFGVLATTVSSIETEIKRTDLTPKQKLTEIEKHLGKNQAKHNLNSEILQYRFYHVAFQALQCKSVAEIFAAMERGLRDIFERPVAAVSVNKP